ncbi:MAG TPA: DUF429 domain-containing protein [Longimicrobium sp.]|jgi:predicted RNase H-like nuclease
MARAEDVTWLGLDLAWSPHNRTGAAALRLDAGGTLSLAASNLLLTDEEIIAWVAAHGGAGPLIVAVDAPLLLPNETGRRDADAAITARFGRFHAGAHSANRKKLAVNGIWRGDTLLKRFADLSIAYATEVPARSPGRWVVEVYPHPATITLFNLERIMPYKARSKRTSEMRRDALRRLVSLLSTLDEPRLAPHALTPLEDALAAEPRGSVLKGVEDRLDALLCAYIAAYAWWWGPERTKFFGDPARGSILVPVPPEWAATHPSRS